MFAGSMAEVYFRQGAARGMQESLRQMLEVRFGVLPESLVNEINAVTEPSRLKAAIVEVLKLQQLADFHLGSTVVAPCLVITLPASREDQAR